jgi:hypothetical protein
VAASGVYTVNKINSIEEEKNSKETPVSSSVQSVARDTKEEAEDASMETSGGPVANQEQLPTSHQKPITKQDPARQAGSAGNYRFPTPSRFESSRFAIFTSFKICSVDWKRSEILNGVK